MDVSDLLCAAPNDAVIPGTRAQDRPPTIVVDHIRDTFNLRHSTGYLRSQVFFVCMQSWRHEKFALCH